MKILITSPEFPPALSGMGDYAFHLSTHLQKIGHSVTVLANHSNSALEETVQGVTVLRSIKKWDWSAWACLRKLILSGGFAIVHLQYLNLTFPGSFFIHFLPLMIRLQCPGVKTAITFHEFAAPLKRLMLLPLLFFGDAYIVTNDHHQRSLSKLCKFLLIPKHIYRIPLAANITPHEGASLKRAAVREQLGVQPDETLLVRFGILHDLSIPGILTILESLKELADTKIPVKLLLIGKEEPHAKQRILDKIDALKIRDRVLLKTNAPSDFISAYLYASDIGLGLYPDGISEKRTAFLSLLAHGIPVIATERGTLPAELIPGKNVLTVPYDAPPNVWSGQIVKLISNQQLRLEIINGGDRISALHQWGRIAESTAVLYHQMKDPSQ